MSFCLSRTVGETGSETFPLLPNIKKSIFLVKEFLDDSSALHGSVSVMKPAYGWLPICYIAFRFLEMSTLKTKESRLVCLILSPSS